MRHGPQRMGSDRLRERIVETLLVVIRLATWANAWLMLPYLVPVHLWLVTLDPRTTEWVSVSGGGCATPTFTRASADAMWCVGAGDDVLTIVVRDRSGRTCSTSGYYSSGGVQELLSVRGCSERVQVWSLRGREARRDLDLGAVQER